MLKNKYTIMRKLIFLLMFFSQFFSVTAQDPLYKGPAKEQVDSFWQVAANLEASISRGGEAENAGLKKELARLIVVIKQKDRSFNTGLLADKMKSLILNEQKLRNERYGVKTVDNTDISEETVKKVNELLAALFDVSLGENKVPNIRSKTEALDKNLIALLAFDRSGNLRTLARYLVRLNEKADDAQNDYLLLEKRCLEGTDKEMAAIEFYRFGYYRSFWDAARKIFPGETKMGQAYDLTSRIYNGMGSVEKLQDIVAANYTRLVKETMIPAPKVKDAGLEQLFMEAYNKMYSESFKGKALKAVILSDDWAIQRNEVSGIVTGRLRKAAIAYKNAEGKCYLIREFFIQQEYVGGAFVGTKSVYAVGKGQEMLCENLK